MTFVPSIPENTPYKALYEFVMLAWTECNNDDDFIFGINGGRGMGKSTIGVHFLKIFFEWCLKKNFTKKIHDAHIISDEKDLEYSIHNLPEFEPIIIDEAVLSLFVGDHAKREVKDLVKLFTVCRDKHRPVGIISPAAGDVVKRLQKYLKYRLRVLRRGLSIVYARDESEGAQNDPFHLKELEQYEGYHDAHTDPNDILKRLRKHPCFKDTLIYPDLPEEVKAWYKERRKEIAYGKDEGRRKDGVALAASIYLNLEDNWQVLRDLKVVSLQNFHEKLLVEPGTTKQLFTPNQFHKSVKENRAKKLTQGLPLELKKQNDTQPGQAKVEKEGVIPAL